FIRDLSQRTSYDLTLFRSRRFERCVRDIVRRFLHCRSCQTVTGSEKPQPINRPAPGQSDHPGNRATASFVKISCSPPDLQENFLQDIFGLFAAIQYTEEKTKQDEAMAIIQAR